MAKCKVLPSMLSKKLAMIKDYVIVHCANSHFGAGGYTQTGELWILDVNILVRDFHNAYVMANYEFWSSMLWKKLAALGQRLIVEIVNLGRGGTHRQGDVWKEDGKFF